jgi:hypothetical protein
MKPMTEEHLLTVKLNANNFTKYANSLKYQGKFEVHFQTYLDKTSLKFGKYIEDKVEAFTIQKVNNYITVFGSDFKLLDDDVVKGFYCRAENTGKLFSDFKSQFKLKYPTSMNRELVYKVFGK